MSEAQEGIVLVRGGGDLASGTVLRLSRSGFLVAVLELEAPTAVRRSVSFCEAVYAGEARVEGLRAVLVADARELRLAARPGLVPVLVDPRCSILGELRPLALVDAILAKRNTGTHLGMAPIVLALGPGFAAGHDAHAVIETNRGHDLGRVIWEGPAAPDTGVPGLIGGYGIERVLRSPMAGVIRTLCEIGDTVRAGEPVFAVEGEERIVVASRIDGVVRGLLRDGFPVPAGFKAADVDPRARREHCFSVSDKARAIGGGALEALLALGARPPVPGGQRGL
jgi:xanthine dehydrogenase accessory factor